VAASAILHLAGYRFVPVADPAELRGRLFECGSALGLLGTVLVAHEGINLCLAGGEQAVRDFAAWLRGDDRFAALQFKESWSRTVPFRRWKVKVKREIIRMDHPAIRPSAGRAPAVDAATLRRWLDRGHDDEGRPLVMLDTRNAFEVDHGTFEGAIDWRIARFTDFPRAFDEHRAQLEGKTVVSFCTGGIRCEKAALYMQASGLDNVWQLEGGILEHFEKSGAAHYRGTCFVFDERETVGSVLEPARRPELP
jgi:UPF0176 protein